MTENECIERLKIFPKWNRDDLWLNADEMENLVNSCIKALEEARQYRAIGTVEECREARERQKAKKPNMWGDGYDSEGNMIYDMYDCPCCGKSYEIDYNNYKYCPECGQHIKWRGGVDKLELADMERSNRYYEDDIFQKIISDLDKMIGIQLKIIAMLNDEVYSYGFSKSLEAYQQARLMIKISLEEYKEKQSDVHYSGGWISCKKKMPEKAGRYYIVSVKNEASDLEYTRPALYDDSGFATEITEKVIAWQPLPESYKGDDTNEK